MSERAIKGWNFMKVRNVFNLVLSTINRFLLITFAGIKVGRYMLRVISCQKKINSNQP